MNAHFFTGFPGFIASELIKELLKQRKISNLYLLVQEELTFKAEEKIRSIMEALNLPVSFEVIPGDITKPGLNIKEETLARLNDEDLIVWHLAAIYDLAVKAEAAWAVNVEGTKNVNDFVQSHPSIIRYMYFSTAYVAGKREGILLETELIRPDAFKNHYEETKFEAEVLVESLKGNTPTTIIRPGIVRGHSETGETIKFDGPYFFMNMIDRLRWLPFIPYVGRTEACINVVPIDYIIKAAVFLSNKDKAAGATVHLTDPSPYTVEEVYEAMVVELTGKKPKGRLPRLIAEKGLSLVWLQQLLGVEFETMEYMIWNATFDTANAQDLLAGSDIKCADFIKSIPVMAAFYNLNKENPEFQIKIK